MKVNAPDFGATPLTGRAIADAAAALKARQEAAANQPQPTINQETTYKTWWVQNFGFGGDC